MRFKMFTVLFLALLYSCGSEQCRTYTHYDWGFNYKVNPNHTTDYGIKVDTSGQEFDNEVFKLMDRMTQEVEQCLGKKVDKTCLKVKIPDNWFISESTGHQLLRDKAPSKGCEDKGLDSKEGCYWRAGLQEDHKVITTPNLYLYKDPIAKMITKSDYIWEEVPECLNPGVNHDWMENTK